MPRWTKLWDGAFGCVVSEPHRPRTKWEAWLDVWHNLAQWQPYRHLTQHGVIDLARGEFVASRSHLAKRWKWGEQAVRGFLTLLEREGMISTRQATPAGTVYRVVNYELYQGASIDGNPSDNQQTTQRQPSGNPLATREVEGKEGKEQEEVKAYGESDDSPSGVAMVRLNGKAVRLPDVLGQLASIRQAEAFRELAEDGLAHERAADVVVRLAFSYWAHMLKHTNARLDQKRAGIIRRRFLESRDPNEILFVVDGVLRDDHLMGRSGSDRKYDGIETIYRDRSQVERLSVEGGYRPGIIHRAAKKYLGLGGQ